MNIQEAIELIALELDGSGVTIMDKQDARGQYLLQFSAFNRSFVCDARDFTTMNNAIKYLIQREVLG